MLQRALPKPPDVRCGNWESLPLAAQQLKYAALDAYASFAVYSKLQSLPQRPPVSLIPEKLLAEAQATAGAATQATAALFDA